VHNICWAAAEKRDLLADLSFDAMLEWRCLIALFCEAIMEPFTICLES
jgi:hypothetical protein